jgi:YbgC/YbaW family acyl-CoA thioester hydrolase
VALSEHRYQRRVEFAETDMAGMVHFSMYLRYIEEAEHAMWREAGLNIADPASPVGFPRIAFSIEYRAPLRFQDEFDVSIRITAISGRTIRYASVVSRGETTVATATHAAVCVRRQSDPLEAVEIPAAIAGRFAISAR